MDEYRRRDVVGFEGAVARCHEVIGWCCGRDTTIVASVSLTTGSVVASGEGGIGYVSAGDDLDD